MAKTLVAYFSVSGVTKEKAEAIAKAAEADIFEIKPRRPYTREDLDWTNPQSRSSLEMKDPDSRPAIAEKVENMAEYDTVFVGFPIWWYTAPTLIKTFMRSHDFSGKKIALFATSGGSDAGKTVEALKPCVDASAVFAEAKLLNGASDAEIAAWVKSI